MPVKAEKRGNKWRVVEASTGKVASIRGRPVDGGGHESKRKAQAQARAINASKED